MQSHAFFLPLFLLIFFFGLFSSSGYFVFFLSLPFYDEQKCLFNMSDITFFFILGTRSCIPLLQKQYSHLSNSGACMISLICQLFLMFLSTLKRLNLACLRVA